MVGYHRFGRPYYCHIQNVEAARSSVHSHNPEEKELNLRRREYLLVVEVVTCPRNITARFIVFRLLLYIFRRDVCNLAEV
jgi:hypothetical protein